MSSEISDTTDDPFDRWTPSGNGTLASTLGPVFVQRVDEGVLGDANPESSAFDTPHLHRLRVV
jgi:hypothetical protein